MKSFTIRLVLTLIFLISFSTYAQFDLGEKIKRKINKEIEKATDDAIDETVETIKKGGKNKTGDESQTDANKDKGFDNESETKTSPKTVREFTSGESFEGRVIFEEEGKQQVIEYYAKDKRYLMEMPEKGGSILFDSHKLKMYVIIDKEKMYMETDIMPLSAGGAGTIKETGETKSILGYQCEKFIFDNKLERGEAWMTNELGAFMFFMESQQVMSEWQIEILDAGYFPLHVTEYDEDGNVESIFRVRKVTPMNLSPDLFVVPSSYKKLDLMNMFGQ